MKISFPTLRSGNGSVSASSHELRHTASKTRDGQKRNGGQNAMALAASASILIGCGNTLYLIQANRAEQNFQEAVELGAEVDAPYEYYSAKVRLEEARHQASQAEYGPASDLSDEAYDYSVKAINICNKAHSSEVKR